MASLDEITIRNELRPGDIGYVIYLHGLLYSREYGYGIDFESYVAKGLHEFHSSYDPDVERAWICEYNDKIIGFLLLMNRNEAAQLRYFIIHPDYRGLGLGKKLMELFMEFLAECNYHSCYLLTTPDLDTATFLYKKYGFRLAEERPSREFSKPDVIQKYEFRLSDRNG